MTFRFFAGSSIKHGLAMVLIICCLVPTTSLNADQKLILFDTDMGNDVDDALALGILHALGNPKSSRSYLLSR